MKHQQSWQHIPQCVCGYRPGGADKATARKLLDRHFQAPHNFYEHVEIIKDLVIPGVDHASIHQNLALAIMHLVEMVEEIHSSVMALELEHNS